MYGAVALSLAEMAARYTTAGGQYRWTALLAPLKLKRGLVGCFVYLLLGRTFTDFQSYSCGSINTIGRIAKTASINIIVFNTSYNIDRWHTFLVYQALNIVTLTYNIFALKRALWTHNIGCTLSSASLPFFRAIQSLDTLKASCIVIVSLASFFVITIICLAIAHPKQSSHYVWFNFDNDTGWHSDALVFLLGLINPTYCFGGLDGAVHLAEDCFEPARTVPRA